MPKEHLQIPGIEAFLNTGRGEGMAQHMGGNLLGNAGAVRNTPDDLLDSPDAVAEGVV